MKKILSVIVVVVVTLTQTAQITTFAQETDKPAVNAQACVLYCVDDGKVYFSVNENKKMKPASTTKLMTSLITLEYADSADKVVAFTKDMTAEGSSMYLKVGEKVKLSDLAAGMMMASGNDAANAAAISSIWKTASRTAPAVCCPMAGKATATSPASSARSRSWPKRTAIRRNNES